jgi:hypothetical protein
LFAQEPRQNPQTTNSMAIVKDAELGLTRSIPFDIFSAILERSERWIGFNFSARLLGVGRSGHRHCWGWIRIETGSTYHVACRMGNRNFRCHRTEKPTDRASIWGLAGSGRPLPSRQTVVTVCAITAEGSG